MGRFANLLGTVLSTFGVGPKGTRATLDASGLTADRTHALPDRSGPVALGERLDFIPDPATATAADINATLVALLGELRTSGLMAASEPVPMALDAAYPNATVGAAYSYMPEVNGDYVGPLTFSILSGAIPAGAGWSFNTATGELSNASPATEESATFVVRVTDSSTPTPQTADSGLQTVEVVEAAASPTLVVLTPNAVVSNGGRSMSHSGGAGTYAHAFTDVPISGKQYLEAVLTIESAGMCTLNVYGGSSAFNVEVPVGQWFNEPGVQAGFSDQWALALRGNNNLPHAIAEGGFRFLSGALPATQIVLLCINGDTREGWIATVDDPIWFGGGDPEAGTTPSFIVDGVDPIVVGVSNAAADRTATLRLPSEHSMQTPAGFTNYMQGGGGGGVEFELVAGFMDLGGGSSLTGYGRDAALGSATSNPGNQCTVFAMQIIDSAPSVIINFEKSPGATGASITYSINGAPEEATALADADPVWGQTLVPGPTIADGDTIVVVLTETFD